MNLHDYDPPLVAICRGLTPQDAPAIGQALFEAGFRLVEVPLNRPGAVEAIGVLARMAPPGVLIGGGTILKVADVEAVHAAGGRMMVAPNCNPDVIRRAVELCMIAAPGIATPTEAFAALDAGAHALKIFPAEVVGPAGVKAITAVLPEGTPLWPVGGIGPDSIAAWRKAGATGFGIGSQLWAPGLDAAETGRRARAFVAAWQSAAAQ